jgi:hypothetical protein
MPIMLQVKTSHRNIRNIMGIRKILFNFEQMSNGYFFLNLFVCPSDEFTPASVNRWYVCSCRIPLFFSKCGLNTLRSLLWLLLSTCLPFHLILLAVAFTNDKFSLWSLSCCFSSWFILSHVSSYFTLSQHGRNYKKRDEIYTVFVCSVRRFYLKLFSSYCK